MWTRSVDGFLASAGPSSGARCRGSISESAGLGRTVTLLTPAPSKIPDQAVSPDSRPQSELGRTENLVKLVMDIGRGTVTKSRRSPCNPDGTIVEPS